MKKNIYQCFPIKYSDYLTSSLLVLVSGPAPCTGLKPCPKRVCLLWDLVPWPRTKPGPLTLGVWRLSHKGSPSLSALNAQCLHVCVGPTPPLVGPPVSHTQDLRVRPEKAEVCPSCHSNGPVWGQASDRLKGGWMVTCCAGEGRASPKEGKAGSDWGPRPGGGFLTGPSGQEVTNAHWQAKC